MNLGLGLGLGFEQGNGSASPVQPVISGLFWDLDANKGTTLATGVSHWADQSDAGNDVAQATGSKQPTPITVDAACNGQASLNFLHTSTQFLDMIAPFTATITPPYTLIVVCTDGNSGTQMVLGQLAADNWYMLAYQSVYSISVGGTLEGTTPDSTALKILYFEYNDPNTTIRVSEETAEATGTAGVSGNLPQLEIGAVLSGANALNGKICKVLGFTGIASSGVRASIMSYLSTRYGITVGP